MKQNKEKNNSKNLLHGLSCIQQLNKVLSFPFLLLILFYRKCISPLFPPSCRFYPTCSEYSYQAFKKYGLFKGLYLSIRRILKCHPRHPGGEDPLL